MKLTFAYIFSLNILFFSSFSLWSMNSWEELPTELWPLCYCRPLEAPQLKIDVKPTALYIANIKLVCRGWNKNMSDYCQKNQQRFLQHFCAEGQWSRQELAQVKAFGIPKEYTELGNQAVKTVQNGNISTEEKITILNDLLQQGLDINYSVYAVFQGVQTLLYLSIACPHLINWFFQQQNLQHLQPNGSRAINHYDIFYYPATDWYALVNTANRYNNQNLEGNMKLYQQCSEILQKKGAFIHIKNQGRAGWRTAKYNRITQKLEFIDGSTNNAVDIQYTCTRDDLAKDYFLSLYDYETQTLRVDPTLFQYSIDVNESDFHRNTLLHEVCGKPEEDNNKQKRLAAITEILLQVQANPNLQNMWGETPLHCAARVGLINHVRILLEYGASLNIKTYTGKTAIDVAREGNRIALVAIMLQEQQERINNIQ